MSVLASRRILLAVTGSIAAYKAADLASKLTQAGALVDVVLTPGAEKFVTPLTFQSVTGRKTYTDADLWGGEAHVLHVGLGQRADLMVIAPATANTLAKLAHGVADNLVTILALAARCPILVAPAMDAGMYEHPATQANIRLLQERGVYLAGPGEGRMASGLVGLGRLLETPELIGHIRLVLGRHGRLAGKKVVVTAGGTQEPLDPVRVLTNKSSGKQGYALAQAALDAGANVVLISAPTALKPPVGAHLVSVQTAEEMKDAVLVEAEGADALLMAAAVADFRPKTVAPDKIKKQAGAPQLELEATPDILVAVAGLGSRRPTCVVGFAAESRDLLENADLKLHSKQLDFIVANDITAPDSGFGVDTNRVVLLFSDGRKLPLPLMSKEQVAEAVINHLAGFLEHK
ncbi:MAG: bifunctional phosphopantothenoylcysteine decarboxylase/phosphopantothenate--cysteine ligase CoaBC [Anaerolineales bacterium]|nr:bifunctional phosphopantothenoylcysteine decarboxylase/phosphopantothenate--cysteine ligase CoaBC [Anaerolineales bacterium]MCX7609852.1 bifunctional phosphopantothenoylcysteine decarboxylase/phosphopantothenate--cysteine ligase CoaBC [Anaerolineales bacterium]MDW8227315.1 bifunctional phosphopantothenoylcysteine decarboxylase/phosphopantothenate--cysteine ligase CoaBC [Anaerolineales bacterium]